MYAVTLGAALSPVGEAIIKVTEGARPIKTAADGDYLLPLFNEVYENALEVTPRLSKKISLHIINSYDVNAFAVGRNTIAVTRGAIEGFTANELKGVLAHEFGHLAYGDTKALLLTRVGNGFFSLVLKLVSLCISLLNWFVNRYEDLAYVAIVFKILLWILNFILWLFMGTGNLIISLNSRYSEYLADGYASRTGYKEQLIGALYILGRIAGEEKAGFMNRAKASHPFTEDRIARLESME